ncbi:MAG: metallophosphoesterase [Desulfosudaceae bacterium]
MFGLILTLLVTVMHVYVFWRAASLPIIGRHLPRPFFLGLGAGIWLVFFLGLFYGHGRADTLARLLELAGMNWMGILFLLTVCLLAVDLLTGFGLIFPGPAVRLRGLALAAGVILSLVGFWQASRPPVIREYRVAIPELPPTSDGLVIAVLSDLHIDSPRRRPWLADIVDRANAMQPDMIVLLGDILEGHGEDRGESGRTIMAELNRLSAPLGVWAVFGNHEFYGGLHKKQVWQEAAGFQWLRNTCVEPSPGLMVAGVDDLTVHWQAAARKRLLQRTLQPCAGGGVTILLSHTPDALGRISRAGVDLMLCGHTHGGQIWPFGYLVKQRYPLVKGLHRVGRTTVIVSTGTGTWGPRMRLWRPNEILKITLNRTEESA